MIYSLIFAINPFIDAYRQSDVFGKLIFLTLILMSVLSWSILIHKIKTNKKLKKATIHFQEIFDKKRQYPLSLEISHQSTVTHPFLEIYKVLKLQTLEILQKNRPPNNTIDTQVYLSSADIDLIASHLSSTIAMQVTNLERHLYILSTTVTLAPFLGLLGTVWGILATFSQLQLRAAGHTNEMVLSGLATALGTTVIGLLVAIPAVVASNFLRNQAKEFQTQMEDFSTLALANVEIQYRQVEV